jgi:hypothetical protein
MEMGKPKFLAQATYEAGFLKFTEQVSFKVGTKYQHFNFK